MDRTRSAHCDQFAPKFDANWGSGEPYVQWMTEEIRTGLRLRSGSTVLDIGSGTGLYASRLVDGTPAAARVICLDPSPAMLRQLPHNPRLIPVVGMASEARNALHDVGVETVDHVLGKGVIHHFDDLGDTTPLEIEERFIYVTGIVG